MPVGLEENAEREQIMGAKNNRKKPRLSICIPTYNRASKLNRLLGNLYEETSGLNDSVEVCISDNASQDNTQEIVATWMKKMPIISSRNHTNLGFDANAFLLPTIAHGDFIWYSGDDDIFFKGAIKRILNDLEEADCEKIDVIMVNYFSNVRGLNKVLFDRFVSVSINSKRYPPLDPSFIGSVCIRRKAALKTLLSIKSGGLKLGAFAHTRLFLECAFRSKNIGVEPNYCVRIISDGGIFSFEKRLYMDAIVQRYNLEMDAHYPWFNFRPIASTFGSYLTRAAIASEEPALESFHQIIFLMHTESLKRSGKKNMVLAMRIMEQIRRNPIAKAFLCIFFEVLRRVHPNLRDIAPNKAELEFLRKEIPAEIARAESLLRTKDYETKV